MLIKIFCITPVVAALLLGCSSNDNKPESPTTSANQTESDANAQAPGEADTGNVTTPAFISSLSCGVSVSSTTALVDTGTGTITDSTIDPAEPQQSTEQNQMASATETHAELQLNCSDAVDASLPGPGAGDTGTGSLSINDSEIALSATTADQENYNNTSDLMLILHNGNTRSLLQTDSVETNDGTESITRLDWGIYDASIAFSMALIQIDTPTFTGGSFNVIASDEDESAEIPADANSADFVFLAQDENGDGVANFETESKMAVSGNINISGESPNWSITLDVTLADGTAVSGVYNGAFHWLPTF